MKYFLIFAISIITLSSSTAQNMLNAQKPQDINNLSMIADEDGNMVEEERHPLPFSYVSDRDILWSTTIWETVDLNQKLNYSYYFPVDTNTVSSNRRSLFDVLMKAIKQGKITEIYADDYFNDKLSYDDVMSNASRTDTLAAGVDQMNEYGSVDPGLISTQFMSTGRVTEYRLKGMWYFDKRLGEMKYRLLAFSPVAEELLHPEATEEEAQQNGKIELFWVWYPDTREVLYNAKVFNGGNTAFALSYDDLLNARRFEANIYKEDNIYGDRKINEYVKTSSMFQLLEGERIKDDIRNFEIDMWSN